MGCVLASGGQTLEQEETWQQERSPHPGGAGPAVPVLGRGTFFPPGELRVVFGEGRVEARVGVFLLGGLVLLRILLVPVCSMEHPSRGQQDMPWAPIALPWVLLQSTHARCQGKADPCPLLVSPPSRHLLTSPALPGFKGALLGL